MNDENEWDGRWMTDVVQGPSDRVIGDVPMH
jgi:hypothetical protein